MPVPELTAVPARPRGRYAVIPFDHMRAVARASAGCDAAVLLVLAWHASFNARVPRGPLAGQLAATVSGPRLAELTGRPLRTVRAALRRLRTRGLVAVPTARDGRTAVYRLPVLDRAGSSESGR